MPETRTELVRFRVTPDELHRLRERAEGDGRTVSGYVRHASLRSSEPRRPESGDEAEERERART